LAADVELRDLRAVDQWAHQHASDRLLRRSRHRGSEQRDHAGDHCAFSLIGSAASGWLCDRFNPRFLLFWYYGLRGLSLALIPFSQFDVVSLSIFSVFYGLDWVATGPPTVALTNQVFGRREAPVIVAWIFAGHQVGGGIAALGAGFVRSATGDYLLAFLISGLACLLASMLVLRIGRPQPVIAAAD